MEANPLSATDWTRHRSALVVSHPGHEVLVHRWMEQAHPIVFILTDGADSRGYSALETTSRTLQQVGASRGCLFGRYPERRLLTALYQGDHQRMLAVAEELAEALLQARVTYLVGDAAEAIHPTHDLCRILIDTAAGIVTRSRPELRNLEFPLYRHDTPSPVSANGRSWVLGVEGEAWERKFAIARCYPACVDELWHTIQERGIDSLREEHLRSVAPWTILLRKDVCYNRALERMPIPPVDFGNDLLPLARALHEQVTEQQRRAA